MELNKKYKFGTEVTDSRYKDKVIVGNFLTGDTVKMTDECYEIIRECIDNQIEIETFVNGYDEESREYLVKLFELLEEKYIIFSEDSTLDDAMKDLVNITLILTNRCNLRCTHCCMDSGCGDIEAELTTEQWKKIIDKWDGLNLYKVSISGGEALLRNDVIEIAEYIKSKYDVYLDLMTNGILINETNVDRLVSLFDAFSISLDGADEESCAPVRGKGTFEKTMRGVNLLKSKGAEKISLSFTIVRQNEDKIDKFKELAKELDALPMLRILDLTGRAAKNPDLIPVDYKRYTSPTLDRALPSCGYFDMNNMPGCASCGAGYRNATINYNGAIYPCSVFLMPGFELGNALEIESFKDFVQSGDIRNNKGYEKFRSYHPAHSEECKDCSAKMFCMNCAYQTYVQLTSENKCEMCKQKCEGLDIVWK